VDATPEPPKKAGLENKGAGAVGTGTASTFSTAFPSELTSTAHIVPPIGDFLPISTARTSPLSRPLSATVKFAPSALWMSNRPARLGRRVEASSRDLSAGRVAESEFEEVSSVHSRVSDSEERSLCMRELRNCTSVGSGVSVGHVKRMGCLDVTGSVDAAGMGPEGR
jgi:hypothetical protein